MGKTISGFVERAISRRTFLQRLTTMAGAFVAGVFGAPKLAYACVGCCNLCVVPSTCTFNQSICTCVWGWVCEGRDCYKWLCKECLVGTLPRGCTPTGSTANCKIWSTNHVDPCRTCNANIPCSLAERKEKIVPCNPT